MFLYKVYYIKILIKKFIYRNKCALKGKNFTLDICIFNPKTDKNCYNKIDRNNTRPMKMY